jgi:arylsulfatase A-like enzyme
MNTIVILMDTLRRDHLGCYRNSPVATPNMNRFAADSMVFENSYVSSYPCMPARQDLFTGQLSFLRRGWSPLEYDQPDLVTLLSQNGIRTALMTDHYHYWQYGSGNYHQSFQACEMIRGQENDNYKTGDEKKAVFPAEKGKVNPRWFRYYYNTSERKNEDDYFTAQVFNRSMEWLEHNYGQDDFFLMLDCFDPHEPFDPPIKYAEPYLPNG